MIVAIVLGTALPLLALAQLIRLRRHQPLTAELFVQDTLISFGVGIAFGFVGYPAGTITLEFIKDGSKLTPRMIAAFDPNQIVVSMVLGALASAAVAVFEYVKRVRRDDGVKIAPPAQQRQVGPAQQHRQPAQMPADYRSTPQPPTRKDRRQQGRNRHRGQGS